jgi:transcriptional regulator GlxA family with amidase domain
MKHAKNIFATNTTPLSITVLVLPDSNTLSFAAAVDPMRAANRQAGTTLFNWHYVTPEGKPASLTSGIAVPGTAIAQVTGCDLLLVIAGFGLAAHDTPHLRASLRRLAGTGATIAGIDGGPWLLAAAGILDGYSATTHWEDLDEFAARFTHVDTHRSRYLIDRTRMTSGGAAPAIDMMLHLIGARFGQSLAAKVASSFIYDPVGDANRLQSRRSNARHNAVTARASALMEQTLDTPLPIRDIAKRLGISTRSLELQFQKRLGTPPKSYFLSLRLTEAHRLVTDTAQPLHSVALATGFTSQSSFARAFKSAFAQNARSLRTL